MGDRPMRLIVRTIGVALILLGVWLGSNPVAAWPLGILGFVLVMLS